MGWPVPGALPAWCRRRQYHATCVARRIVLGGMAALLAARQRAARAQPPLPSELEAFWARLMSVSREQLGGTPRGPSSESTA